MDQGARAGRFLLGERLGAEGFPQRWSAREEGSDGACCVELYPLRESADPKDLGTLLQALGASERLVHRSVVRVRGAGVAEGALYVATEPAPGVHLGEAQRERVPGPVAALVGAQLCCGLEAGHRLLDADWRPAALVHRGLVPERCRLGVDGVGRVTGFALGRAVSRVCEVPAGYVTRLLRYASPETALGREGDRTSDLFSLAVVLWEWVAGRELFPAATAAQAIKAVCEQPIPPLHEVAPEAPPQLGSVLARALARERRDRFDSATELAEALRAVPGVAEAQRTDAPRRYLAQAFADRRLLEPCWAEQGDEPDERVELDVRSLRLEEALAPIPAAPVPKVARVEPIVPREEARRFRRWDAVLPAAGVVCEPTGRLRDLPQVVLQNVSQGGVRVRCPTLVPANAVVELGLSVGRESLSLRGRVRWWHRLTDDYEFGLQFDVPQPELVGKVVKREGK